MYNLTKYHTSFSENPHSDSACDTSSVILMAMEEGGSYAKSDNALVRMSYEFALKAVRFSELLESNKKFVISHQFLKSATSVAANVIESQHSESRADFIHKLKIASKELQEAEFWLNLCKDSPSYPNPGTIMSDTLPLKKLLSSIISTAKKNAQRSNEF
ncbi:MAG: hypothetical protein RL220_54 [Bacteroidota bacterium]